MFPPVVAAAVLAAPPEPVKPFEFKDGDRVVWLGGTLVEREQRYGYWEAALLAANRDKRLTVRNLGWSGDTVHGEARGRFDFANPEKCFRQLVDQTLELKPTVIFVCYGANESFDGKDGLPRFEKGLEKLLDALKPAGARVVLFTPMRFEEAAPASKRRNEELKSYAEVVRKVGRGRGLPVADLFAASFLPFLAAESAGHQYTLTDNGMHLNETGYREQAEVGVLFSLEWAHGAQPEKKPEPMVLKWDELEPLRKAVVAKNELFFHRWRPQNETYLFGFRKHEQGRNAKEVAELDPLVAKAEDEIEKLRKALTK
jgi:lysophospholipase L1-like esterase